MGYKKTNYNTTINNYPVTSKKYRRGFRRCWVYKNDSNLSLNKYPFSLIDSIIFAYNPKRSGNFYNRKVEYKLLAIKYHDLGWFYKKRVGKIRGKKVSYLKILKTYEHLDKQSIIYSLCLDKKNKDFAHLTFKKSLTTSRIKVLDSEQDSCLDIYFFDNSNVFTVSNNANPRTVVSVLPFVPEKVNSLLKNGTPFTGFIGVAKLSKVDYRTQTLYPNLEDTGALDLVNPQLKEALESIKKRYDYSALVYQVNPFIENGEQNRLGKNSLLPYFDRIVFFEIYKYSNGALDSVFSFNYKGDLVDFDRPFYRDTFDHRVSIRAYYINRNI